MKKKIKMNRMMMTMKIYDENDDDGCNSNVDGNDGDKGDEIIP